MVIQIHSFRWLIYWMCLKRTYEFEEFHLLREQFWCKWILRIQCLSLKMKCQIVWKDCLHIRTVKLEWCISMLQSMHIFHTKSIDLSCLFAESILYWQAKRDWRVVLHYQQKLTASETSNDNGPKARNTHGGLKSTCGKTNYFISL
jgi:hypothetical protein